MSAPLQNLRETLSRTLLLPWTDLEIPPFPFLREMARDLPSQIDALAEMSLSAPCPEGERNDRRMMTELSSFFERHCTPSKRFPPIERYQGLPEVEGQDSPEAFLMARTTPYAFRLPSGRQVHFVIEEIPSPTEGRSKGKPLPLQRITRGAEGALHFHFIWGGKGRTTKAHLCRFLDWVRNARGTQNPLCAEEREELLAVEKEDPFQRRRLERHLEFFRRAPHIELLLYPQLEARLLRALDTELYERFLPFCRMAGIDRAGRIRHLESALRIRCVAERVITFLAEVERRLLAWWHTPPPLQGVGYGISLARIPTPFHPRIVANRQQREQWRTLCNVEVPENPSPRFAEAHPTLAIDTACFDDRFTLSLLSSIDRIDDELGGIAIEGENACALRLLVRTFRGKIRFVYIDPPYNSGSKALVYPDDLPGRTWCAMMRERLTLVLPLLTSDALFFASIDDRAYPMLRALLDAILPEGYLTTLIWKKKKQPSFLSRVGNVTEYILVHARRRAAVRRLSIERVSDPTQRIDNATNPESVRHFPAGIRYRGKPDTVIAPGVYRNRTMETEFLDPVHVRGGIVQHPFRARARFRYRQEEITRFCEAGLLYITARNSFRRLVSAQERRRPKTISNLLLDWGQTQDSHREFRDLFGAGLPFPYPKPLRLLENLLKCSMIREGWFLDFFAGTATTAHALLRLNREDGGKRRFLVVEGGESFERFLLPRLFKAIYANRWEEGIPRKEAGEATKGTIFKYLRLAPSPATSPEEPHFSWPPPAGGVPLCWIETFNLHHALVAQRFRIRGDHVAVLACDCEGGRIVELWQGTSPIDPVTFGLLLESLGIAIETMARWYVLGPIVPESLGLDPGRVFPIAMNGHSTNPPREETAGHERGKGSKSE
ncbi:MAG: site-specific DNA-methyltransferase [Deltaproteobacteria bacterium]|nr:MAG: site-specific DNA-methyltransferase [Deltaproteobacteria bacterium]